ncbi:hypothetical protein F441_08730 [Phytophthora nicotianae CJ01A1]|uniref:Uncharacterized protein n=4 Tax=Phytophthora nicotianae TaxID=4792 RepID=W2Q7A2_PHYN3|nr:hypothetical protein PPTG_11097 [Phytophthora nicotianae INRA-310]ETP16713.1 hypothetical protein F441_08730 [Phytophthora nicotianae CJ01A1]ETP44773.1 hypothetical protein F442_08688 [Phytophthora nicotianae P10297]KUF88137.1 hypothetical protein AM588_10001724 [Phytophthora nicotianae]ETN09037.1 hypothetical protein PPTG_11097 [Phytophthora nicotianae INRA-310]KUG01535.1 hypothetical protein AM587_10007359 [Phytophthora nicotianae]
MDQTASHQLLVEANNALVQELKATVERMQDVEVELDDVQLALKEDREEVETYTDDIADCWDRINAIDEFVRDLEAGNVPAMDDVTTIVSNMAEEREEEEAMLTRLGEVRACHEQQIQQMNAKLTTLQEEKLMLQKKSAQIWCVLGRTGVFELAMRRLSERTIKTV